MRSKGKPVGATAQNANNVLLHYGPMWKAMPAPASIAAMFEGPTHVCEPREGKGAA